MAAPLPELLTVVAAHALAVASPGPDFAIVLRQSLRHGRRTAIWTSAGIASGLCVHITYTLLGLGLWLRDSPTALTTVKYLGAAYFAWVGIQAIRTAPRAGDVDLAESGTTPAAGAAWTSGFLVNLLNPKAVLFFVSLFPLAVSATTPRGWLLAYGIWMTVATFGWFSFVSVVFARESARRAFLRHGHWIDRALGLVFLGFAVSLAFTALR